MKVLSSILTTFLSIVIVILAILLVGIRLIGYIPYTVLSASMEPAYKVGSLVYVKSIPAEEIVVGDAITFVMNEDLLVATHRVVEIDQENQRFTTKGDANKIVDGSPVHFNNLLGRVAFTVPFLGYVANFINTPSGRWVAVAVVLFIILLLFLPDLFKVDKTVKQSKDEDTGLDSDPEALSETAIQAADKDLKST